MNDRFIIPSRPVSGPDRPATASDTRLALRHPEDQPPPKKDEKEREPGILPEDSYDQMVLGVRALIDFLTGFLRDLGTHTPDIQRHIQPEKPPVSSNSYAARAAGAYAHTAQAQPHASTQTPPPQEQNALLSGADIQQIHRVLAKLNTLENKGIMGLHLTRAATFMDSIEAAAEAALAI